MELERKYADFAAEKAIELIGIDSPSGFTEKAAEWVKNEFEALGFAARMTEKRRRYCRPRRKRRGTSARGTYRYARRDGL